MSFIKEGAIISCYLDAAAILAMLLLLVLSERLRQRKTPSYERFYRFAATVLATCVICLVYNAMYMQPAPWCRRVALVSRTVREYAVMLVVLQWSAYVYRKLYGEAALRPVVRGAFLLPAAVFAALLFVNLFTGIIFTLSPDNRMVPMPLYTALFAVDFLYFISSIVIVRLYDRKAARTRMFGIMPMVVFVIIGSVPQFFADYDIGILGFAVGVILLYFSTINELRFIDEESGLYNRAYLYTVMNLTISGRRVFKSVLIFETTGNLRAAFDILRNETQRYGDIIRVDSNRFLVFTEQESLAMIRMWSSVVTDAAEKYSAAHPGETVAIRGRGRLREASEDVFAFINSTVEDRETGSYFKGLTSMIEELDRLDDELSLAANIQNNMLPMIFPPFPDRHEFDLYASMNAAKEVGGDFYDFFLVDQDHLALVIADVSGKGVPAALFMMVSKTLIKNQLMTGLSPAEALANVNLQLCERNTAKMFVTVWAAVLEISTGKGLACNAGHENPGLRRTGGSFELIAYKHNIFIGVSRKAHYADRPFEMKPGDSLFVYTDGVPEAKNAAGEMFGSRRLETALNDYGDVPPDVLIGGVRQAVRDFAQEAPQFDDITMLALKYHGLPVLYEDQEENLRQLEGGKRCEDH